MSTQGSDSEVAKSQPEEELKRDEAGENVAADKEGAAGPPAWINDAPDGGRDAWLMVLLICQFWMAQQYVLFFIRVEICAN
jgi:hypothetical protein